MRAFITGSRAYGTPKKDSDIDLVIRVSAEVIELLRGLCDSPWSEEGIKFGMLNLICCDTDEKFAAWKVGTTEMQKADCKFSRDEAIKIIRNLELRVGTRNEDYGGTK